MAVTSRESLAGKMKGGSGADITFHFRISSLQAASKFAYSVASPGFPIPLAGEPALQDSVIECFSLPLICFPTCVIKGRYFVSPALSPCLSPWLCLLKNHYISRGRICFDRHVLRVLSSLARRHIDLLCRGRATSLHLLAKGYVKMIQPTTVLIVSVLQ
jgi:hypothetical protein